MIFGVSGADAIFDDSTMVERWLRESAAGSCWRLVYPGCPGLASVPASYLGFLRAFNEHVLTRTLFCFQSLVKSR